MQLAGLAQEVAGLADFLYAFEHAAVSGKVILVAVQNLPASQLLLLAVVVAFAGFGLPAVRNLLGLGAFAIVLVILIVVLLIILLLVVLSIIVL